MINGDPVDALSLITEIDLSNVEEHYVNVLKI